jgi:hypothetical protein
MNYKTLISGLSTHVPGGYDLLIRLRNSSSGGAAKSARYCYSVWLRHLVMAKNNNLIQNVPETIAELGPGDSLGVGLAALLSGSKKYYALDVVPHANLSGNLSVFDDLVNLFHNREPIPDDTEWPDIFPKLTSYEFPKDILSDEIIDAALKPERIASIKNALVNPANGSSDIEVQYFVPWTAAGIIRNNSVDFVISQAVMEHIVNLDEAYSAIYQWLRMGGGISMEIDFSNHVMANKWNEHWTYSDFMWDTIVWGKRPYSLNRQPHSIHLALCEKHNFNIVSDIPHYDCTGIPRGKLHKCFKGISDEDLLIKNSFLQCKK